MKAVEKIELRAAACGIAGCSVLAMVSDRLEINGMMARLDQRPEIIPLVWVQCTILFACISLSYGVNRKDLLQLYRAEGRKSLLRGLALMFAFQLVGFMMVGAFLPAKAAA